MALSVILLSACQPATKSTNSQGTPYPFSVYTAGIQQIPGLLQCEFYNLGGEGIAYHDSDSTNSGSGALNPANGAYLHEFRSYEAVNISYTKFGLDALIDDNLYNFAVPEPNQLYVGWTNPGEWMK